MDSVAVDILTYLSLRNITIFVLSVLALYLINIMNHGNSRNIKLPPGPPNLPLVGTLPFHGFTPSGFAKLRNKYGDIITIYVGSVRCVILNSYDSIRGAFVNRSEHFSSRGTGYVVQQTNPSHKGIIQADYDEKMRKCRNTSLAILRTLGCGKPIMEEKIAEEAKELLQAFANQSGEPFDPRHIITNYVTNVITSILLNETFHHNDRDFENLLKNCDDFTSTGFISFALDYFPFLRILPYVKNALKTHLQSHSNVLKFLVPRIQQHIDSHVKGMDSDFLHMIIDKNPDPDNIDKDYLKYLMRDFFIAGMESVATSIKWTLIMMANNQDIQRKIHDELDAQVGRDRAITLSDKEKLSYTEAMIWEVQRFKTVSPVIPHYVHQDTTLAGFDIPADTKILPNLDSVHLDAEIWGDPQNFRPERFLDENGTFVRHPQLIPFSIGKRQCVAEVLARQELFLFTTALLQWFRFEPPDGTSSISGEGVIGFAYSPHPFKIKAIVR